MQQLSEDLDFIAVFFIDRILQPVECDGFIGQTIQAGNCEARIVRLFPADQDRVQEIGRSCLSFCRRCLEQSLMVRSRAVGSDNPVSMLGTSAMEYSVFLILFIFILV